MKTLKEQQELSDKYGQVICTNCNNTACGTIIRHDITTAYCEKCKVKVMASVKINTEWNKIVKTEMSLKQ